MLQLCGRGGGSSLSCRPGLASVLGACRMIVPSGSLLLRQGLSTSQGGATGFHHLVRPSSSLLQALPDSRQRLSMLRQAQPMFPAPHPVVVASFEVQTSLPCHIKPTTQTVTGAKAGLGI